MLPGFAELAIPSFIRWLPMRSWQRSGIPLSTFCKGRMSSTGQSGLLESGGKQNESVRLHATIPIGIHFAFMIDRPFAFI